MVTTNNILPRLYGAALSLCTMVSVVFAQSGTDVVAGDWPDLHGNMAAQRYSPLDQITAENV
ncbi:MAG: hypothetical protein P8J52_01285, partial [Gammaproteobacteria bacterium]|nr:hypothetical protein [Gammaproteobacteria bacterium]